MASTYLTRTQSSDTTNYNFTFSFWVKRSKLGSSQAILATQTGNDEFRVEFDSSDRLFWYKYNGSSFQWNLYTIRKFRDTNAYYNICLQYDSTQGTASNRLKMYVNGVQETDFQSGYENYPSQNENSFAFQGGTAYIGCDENTNGDFDGILSHINMVHGSTPVYTSFGSTDSTTGEWKINTSPNVTYGTQGYFILKDGNSVTDQSPNTNNWSVGSGTLTKTEDCPSNVFATFNPLIKTPSGLSFSHGNTTLTTTNSQWEGCATTLAPSSGKWYWEAKYNTGSGIRLDIARLPADLRFFDNSNQSYLTYAPYGYGYQLNNSGYDYYGNNNSMTTWTTNRGNSTKIYMVAVDLDNGKWWIGADGSWFNKSGTANPVTGADPLHDFSANLNGEPWLFGMSVEGSGGSHNANFGNGYFGTTAVSSAGTNASGIGIFEYDVPTGYTALSTKGLNE